MLYLSNSAYILNILYIPCYNESVRNWLSGYQLQSQDLIIQKHWEFSWLRESKEYQEPLETQSLIVNCLLEMTEHG